MSARDGDSWLRPEPDARSRPVVVVHFPHAGGSSATYRSWAPLYPSDVGFVGVELPGRGRRSEVPAPDSIDAVADAVARELHAWSGYKVALFGHSLGALLAYEVALRAQRGGREVAALIVSGSRAPSEDLGRPSIAHLDHAQFSRTAVELGLASAELTDDPVLAALFLEPLRNDLALCERYPWGRSAPLALPMAVLGARDDHLVPLSSARSWQQLSAPPASVTVFSGGHMFVRGAARDVVSAICAVARPDSWLKGCSRPD